MASERQIQDKVSETQPNSLGIEQAQQSSNNKPTDKQIKSTNSEMRSSEKSDLQSDSEHLKTLNLVTKNLQDRLNSIDANTSS